MAVRCLISGLLLGWLVGCSVDDSMRASLAPGREVLLYQRLGGLEGIRAIIDETLLNIRGDERIRDFFAATFRDPRAEEHLRQQLVSQICEAVGGPCRYTGRAMVSAHRGRGIRDEHFDAFLEDVQLALIEQNVAPGDRAELLDLLRPMRSDIVGA